MTKLVSASSVKGLFPNSSTDVDVVASPPEKNRKRKSIARKIVLIFCGVVCGFVALIVVAAILVPDKSRNGGKSSNVIKSAKPATKPHKALSEFSSSELRDANRLAKLEKAAADQFFFEYSHAKNDAERKATSDGYKNVVNQLFEEERQRGLEDIMDNYRDIYSVRAGPRLP